MVSPVKRDWVHAVFPVALAVLVFARSVTFPFVTWDDPLHLTENPLPKHPLAGGLGFLLRTPMLGYPVPLLELSYALDRAVFGLSPGSRALSFMAHRTTPEPLESSPRGESSTARALHHRHRQRIRPARSPKDS